MERVSRGHIETILTNEIGLGAEVVSRGRLMTVGALESFDLVTLISLLEERFGIEITASLITPPNFDSIDSIVALVESLDKGGQAAIDVKRPHANLAE